MPTLNIKDETAYKLARELAHETGETMTRAVTEAIRERLEHVRKRRRKASAEELMEIGRRCARLISESDRAINPDDLLYDENGLPK